MERNIDNLSVDSTNQFTNELSLLAKKYPPLTLSEESELAKKIQSHLKLAADPKAKFLHTEEEILALRNKLCRHNILFIFKHIKKLYYADLKSEYGIVLGDLMNQAYEGAFQATLKYNGEYKFSTFAFRYFMEWGAISIKKEASAVRIPLDIIKLKNKLYKEQSRYYAANGIEPSDDILSNRLNINLEDVEKLNSKRENHPVRVSLSTELTDDFTVGETLDSGEYADLKVDRDSIIKELSLLTSQLKETEERIIIEALFGFGRFENEIPLISYQSHSSTKQIFSDVVTDMLLKHFIEFDSKYEYSVEDSEIEEMFLHYKKYGENDIPPHFSSKRFQKMIKLITEKNISSIEILSDRIQNDEYRSRQNSLIYCYKNAVEKLRKFYKMKETRFTTIVKYTESKIKNENESKINKAPKINAAQLEQAINERKRKPQSENIVIEHYTF